MYYDKAVMTCKSCGHNQFATADECLVCGGELEVADEETTKRMRDAAIKKHEEANLKKMERILQEISESKTSSSDSSPRCPLCRSTNIQKISTAKRIVHGYAFGLFSNTARSQWECKNCGNKF